MPILLCWGLICMPWVPAGTIERADAPIPDRPVLVGEDHQRFRDLSIGDELLGAVEHPGTVAPGGGGGQWPPRRNHCRAR